jgi:ParB family chromosome partitioning protein
MTLRSKAAKIDLSDLAAPTGPSRSDTETPAAEGPPPSVPRVRSGVEAISQSISVRHRVLDLEEKLQAYEEAGVVVLLDPRRIRHSRWKNRHEDSYATPEFAQLRKEIESAGRNVQPIKVRRLGEAHEFRDEYELVYGRRRHRACLELGLPVAAIIEQVSDTELFVQADRENRMRADLTPWEQGVMYADALAQGLFPSQRRMAEMLGVDHSAVGKAIRLAQLPRPVIEAFRTPLEIQFRWGSDIAEAMTTDPQRVLAVAESLKAELPRRPGREVYAALVGIEPASPREQTREFTSAGKVVAEWETGRGGAATIKVRAGALSAEKERRLREFLQRLFD